MLTFSQAAAASPCGAVALERRDEAPALDLRRTTWVESRLWRSASPRSMPRGVGLERGRVVDADADPREALARAARRASRSVRDASPRPSKRTTPERLRRRELGQRSPAARAGARPPRGARRSPAGSGPCRRRSPPAAPRARTRAAGGRRCAGCAPRTRAGRRSRTASGSRSWSRRACTGRGRSPRRGATRPAASSALVHQLVLPRGRSSAASKVGRPRSTRPCVRSRSSVSRCRAGSSRGTGSAAVDHLAARPRPASGSARSSPRGPGASGAGRRSPRRRRCR